MRLFLIIFMMALTKCNAPDTVYPIKFENHSEHSVSLYFALGGKFGTLYPDTLLPKTNEYLIKDISTNNKYYLDSGIEWERIMPDLPSDTMSVFILHTDTLNKYSWATIRDDYLILKRYDLSLEDLQANDFTITYP